MSNASITTLFSSWDVDMISSTALLLLSFPHLTRTVSFTSWAQVISYYALLMVSISVGRNMKYLSRSVYYFITSENVLMESNYRSEQITIVYSLLMLGVCFLILGITNRYSWIMFCYGMIANASATLQCVADSHLSMQNSSLSASMGIGNDFSSHLYQDEASSMDKLMMGSYQPSNRYNVAVSFEAAKRTIIVFIFTALLCVLFFDESGAGAYPLQAPGATHCFMLLSVMCIATALNRISQSDYICHRRNSVVGRCIAGCKALLRSLVYYALYKLVGHRMATYVSSALEASEEKYVEIDGADSSTTALSNHHHHHHGHGHYDDKGKGGRDVLHAGDSQQAKKTSVIGNLTGDIETNARRHEGRLPPFFASTFKDWNSDDDGKARIAFFKTLMWRQMHRIDDIFTMPQAKFYQMVEYFPHAIHGKSREGCVVVYEKLGSANAGKLREVGISPEMLVYHFIMRNEFVLRRIYERDIEDIQTTKAGSVTKSKSSSLLEHGIPSSAAINNENEEDDDDEGNGPSRKIALEEVYPEGDQKMLHLVSVLDVKGISMGDVTSDVLSFLRQSGEIMDMHYPGVVKRLIIVNAPTWFWTIWSMISRVFSESIRQKISIVGDCKSLDEHIDPSQRPQEFGGTDVPLGEHPQHKAFMGVAQQWVDSGEYVMYAANGSLLSAGKDDEDISPIEENDNTNGEGNNTQRREEEGNGGDDGDSYISDDSFSAGFTSRRVQKRGKGRKPKRMSRRRPDYYEGSSSDSSSSGSSSTSSDSDTSRDTLLEDDTQGKDKGGMAAGAVGGFFGWMSSRFKQTPQAYMGEKNGYEFDEESGLWRIRFDAEDSSRDENDYQPKRRLAGGGNGRSGDLPLEKLPGERLSGMRSPTEKMTKEQLEEHGLVLAIQAAHLAARMKKGNNIVGNEFGVDISKKSSARDRPALASSSSDSIQKEEYKEERDYNLGSTPSKTKKRSFSVTASPSNAFTYICNSCFCCISMIVNMFKTLQQHEQILVLTGVMYFATCATLAGLLTMIPVWCLSPKEFGGKGYGVVEMGLVMSTAGLVVLQYHLYFRHMARQQAQISPLKGIRVSALILVASLMLMPVSPVYLSMHLYLSLY